MSGDSWFAPVDVDVRFSFTCDGNIRLAVSGNSDEWGLVGPVGTDTDIRLAISGDVDSYVFRVSDNDLGIILNQEHTRIPNDKLVIFQDDWIIVSAMIIQFALVGSNVLNHGCSRLERRPKAFAHVVIHIRC